VFVDKGNLTFILKEIKNWNLIARQSILLVKGVKRWK